MKNKARINPTLFMVMVSSVILGLAAYTNLPNGSIIQWSIFALSLTALILAILDLRVI